MGNDRNDGHNKKLNDRGADFFELRTLYATQYPLLNNISDKLAERARMLGGFTIGSLAEYLSHTRLEEQPGDVEFLYREWTQP